jgi:hypothetical protein
VRPFVSCDCTFNRNVVNLTVIFSLLPLVLEVQVGVSDDCVDGFECWKIVVLLRGFLVLRRRKQQCVELRLWLSCLGTSCRVCYL